MVYSTMEEICQRIMKKLPISCVETKDRNVIIVTEKKNNGVLNGVNIKFDIIQSNNVDDIQYYGFGMENVRGEDKKITTNESCVEHYLLCLPRIDHTKRQKVINIDWKHQY